MKFGTILKYHEWYLRQISRTNHAIICLYYQPQKVVIFTCRYFILSRNTTALSQSNCRNFSCSGIKGGSTLERTRKVRAYLSSFKKEEKAEYGLIRLANKPLWDAVICNIEVFKRICKCNGYTLICCKLEWFISKPNLFLFGLWHFLFSFVYISMTTLL